MARIQGMDRDALLDRARGRGVNPLVYWGLRAILQTARHEFAHLAGAPQSAVWRVDVAARLATACGPPEDAGAPYLCPLQDS